MTNVGDFHTDNWECDCQYCREERHRLRRARIVGWGWMLASALVMAIIGWAVITLLILMFGTWVPA